LRECQKKHNAIKKKLNDMSSAKGYLEKRNVRDKAQAMVDELNGMKKGAFRRLECYDDWFKNHYDVSEAEERFTDYCLEAVFFASWLKKEEKLDVKEIEPETREEFKMMYEKEFDVEEKITDN
ncbi:hypothetical protein RFI_26351, partial [Reticulomyxa filosa]